MINHENKNYYSSTEIARAFNDDVVEFKNLKKKWCEVYNKANDYFFVDQSIQTKLYKAIHNNMVRGLTYQKTDGGRTYFVFNIEDLIKFLENPASRRIESKQAINIKVIGAEE